MNANATFPTKRGTTGSGDDASRIANDRDLLDELQMSDADAAMFLGKSRQALNAQLGPKKGEGRAPPSDYFKLSDILILTSAARQLGRSFDAAAVKGYVDSSRKPATDTRPYELLISLLKAEPEGLDTEGADSIILILPAFQELRTRWVSVATFLRRLVGELNQRVPRPRVLVLGSTATRARMAGQWLRGVPDEDCFGSDMVDHYLPTIMAYRRAEDDLRIFVLTEEGSFKGAPSFVQDMMAGCVRSMLPLAARSALDDGKGSVDEDEEDQAA
jgi:hypothetical protein